MEVSWSITAGIWLERGSDSVLGVDPRGGVPRRRSALGTSTKSVLSKLSALPTLSAVSARSLLTVSKLFALRALPPTSALPLPAISKLSVLSVRSLPAISALPASSAICELEERRFFSIGMNASQFLCNPILV